MKKIIFLFSMLLALGMTYTGKAQNTNKELLSKTWEAQWIAVPGESPDAYGVYVFRKELTLPMRPSSFIIHISADNRYKLFVNEKLVSLGPARGDFYFWNFETVDIAPYLLSGKNVIAALVWNEAGLRPEAQSSFQTGFILQGNSQSEQMLNTNTTWKCAKDSSYHPLAVRVPGYYAAGPAEYINMRNHLRDWDKKDFADTAWLNARPVMRGTPKGVFNFSYGWMLTPSPLPQMELTKQRLVALRRSEGVKISPSFPGIAVPVDVPAYTSATILMDQTYLTNAYPTLVFSGGRNAGISISYAESLYKDGSKGNRNEIDGKVFIGKKDSILSDGSISQTFTPLWWRTYRYIQLKIKTQEEPLILNDIYGTFTAYPLQRESKVEIADTGFRNILNIGWHTARLCAFETYMDCPYFEQLQYIGDARIQALVTLFNTKDDRLVRNAITQMDHSRMAEGITQSRYPTVTPQQIPTFSLWWIGMLYDYWMYRADSGFIKEKLPGERQVLSFFYRYQITEGSLRNLPYWVFTDWVENRSGWKNGVAPLSKDGGSAIVDIQLLWTYQLAAQLENKLGMKEYALNYNKLAAQLKRTILKKYWDPSRKLFADTEEKDVFSQHANALAILAGVVNGPNATAIGRRLLADTSLAPASIYFKYYLHRALVKAGLGDQYLNWLDKWYENIRMGLTTWAEMSDVAASRSDCHGWGASPNIEFFRTVLGIDSDAPGFARVRIEPHLGAIQKAGGEIPHPDGTIKVHYLHREGKWEMEVALPGKTSGVFIWKGRQYLLKSGKNNLRIEEAVKNSSPHKRMGETPLK